jgi:hypothetical protein
MLGKRAGGACVSPTPSVFTFNRLMVLRHWASAIGIEATTLTSSSFTPGLAISWKWIGLNRSPMMRRPDEGRRWCTSATRPAMEFSTGIMPSWQSPTLDRLERLLEGRMRHGLHVRKRRGAGLVAVGAQLALEGDPSLSHEVFPSLSVSA